MKRMKQISVFIVTLLFCLSMHTVQIFAETVTQDGLEVTLTTDKEEYFGGEQIKLTLNIKNTNPVAVRNLSLVKIIPEGYELADGFADELEQQIDTLEPGEEVAVVVEAEESEANPPEEEDKNPEDDEKKDEEEAEKEEDNTENNDKEENETTEDEITEDEKNDTSKDEEENKKDNSSINSDKADNSGDDGNKDNSTAAVSTPKTGDNKNILMWCMILTLGIICAGIGGYLFVKNKKVKKILSVWLCLGVLGVCAGEISAAETEERVVKVEKKVLYDGEEVTFGVQLSYPGVVAETPQEPEEEEYKLVWEEQFEGTELNRNDWNVELHAPGWVNAEWQEYVDSEQNIYVKDGKLVIKPIKTMDENGQAHYTSGRINTQNKKTFTYGKFEARLKVPAGMGYLPAFWLMANDENLYGQWPRCGEIDIMEVMGQTPNTLHGTIHYGNPHSQSQGTYVLDNGSFADEFHTFAVEWEPGKISWYVDGELYHTENDWYSVTEGQGEISYPAPFDQPFYVILNLAVGGSWVGYPDDTTDFENAAYEVDYVRVYQKDSYNEDVEKPVKEVVLREPDASGSYIINGNFAEEDLTDEAAWKFLLANGGDASAVIANNELTIQTRNAGTVDYSVQLVQAGLPMQEGATYKLTFDALAGEARQMIVDVSAPDRNYTRYMADTKVNLSTEKQSYTYEFKMTGKNDANGRLEFNMGNQGSVADIKISNVRLEKVAYEEPDTEGNKTVLADGNYVYNGNFQEGKDRMAYWNIVNNAGAEVFVTNTNNERRLKIVAPEGTSSEKAVIISQKGLALTEGSNYAFSFDIEGENGEKVDVAVAGVSYGVELTSGVQTFNNIFTLAVGAEKEITFTITQPGTFYLDNVRIVEDSLIKNGSFAAGFAGYEPYVDGSASASYVVDSLTENNAADFTIENTGDQAWKIQLKQNHIKLEKGQWYKLTLDAKSSINRKLMFAIQRDGSLHNDDWTPYSGEKIVDLTNEYQTQEIVFQMTEETDEHSVLSISMGAVGGTQITEQHRVVIDNINLEKTEAPVIDSEEAGKNLIKNGNFAEGEANWDIYAITPPASATATVRDGKVIYEITDTGVEDWNIQLKQGNLTLEQGEVYKVSFKIKSTADRIVKYAFLDPTYAWYGGADVVLTANEELTVSADMTVDKVTANNISFVISMGKIAEVATPASTIEISDISVIKQ